jgi:hypothetical protein
MAKKLYTSGNYIIADDDAGNVIKMPQKGAVLIDELPVNFTVNNIQLDLTISIPKADFSQWEDAESGGAPYASQDAMEQFFLDNTANFSGAVTALDQIPDVPAYANNGGKVLRVKTTEDGIEYLDLNIANIAFVHPTLGSASGELGNPFKPFNTISGAASAASVIYLQYYDGYTELVTLASNKTYLDLHGSRFTAGGLRAPSGTLSNCRWLGRTRFEGNFGAVYFITFCRFVNFVLEFDYIKTTGNAFPDFLMWANYTGLKSNVSISCNYIDSFGGNGQATGFIGDIDGVFNIKDKLIGYYQLLAFGFTGFIPPSRFTVNCPQLIIRNGGWAGNSGFKQPVVVYGAGPNMDIEINGRFTSEGASLFGSIASALVTWAGGSGGRIAWHGDKNAAQYPRGIYNTRPDVTVISSGNLDVPNGRLFELTNTGTISISEANTSCSTASSVASTGEVYLKNTQIEAKGVAQNVITLASATAKVYCSEVSCEGDGGAGLFINTNGNAYSSGLKSVASTQANDGAFTNEYAALQAAGSGFTVEPNLKTDKNY